MLPVRGGARELSVGVGESAGEAVRDTGGDTAGERHMDEGLAGLDDLNSCSSPEQHTQIICATKALLSSTNGGLFY